MMLETTFQFPMLVLVLTFVCILSLYPFLHNLNDKLVYDVGVGKLHKEISSLIDSNDEYFAKIKANSLFIIGKKCIKDNRQDTFDSIIYIFDISAKKAEKQNMVEIIERIGRYYSNFLILLKEDDSTTTNGIEMIMSLLEIIDSHVDKYSETIKCDDLIQLTSFLKEAGMSMVNAGLDDRYMNRIVRTLRNIFFRIQKKREYGINRKVINGKSEIGFMEEQLEPDIVDSIRELATISYNRTEELSALNTSVKALWEIGAKSCQVYENYGLSSSYASYEVAQQLKRIEYLKRNGTIVGISYLDGLLKKSKDTIKYNLCEQELNAYLDKFRLYYDSVEYDTRKVEVKVVTIKL